MLTKKNQTLNSPRASRLFITGGTLGPLLLILVFLIEGATRSGYDVRLQTVSALSLSDQGLQVPSC